MKNYKEDFDEFMIGVNGNNPIGIWWSLGLSDHDELSLKEKFNLFKEFFCFAIKENRIIEYDLKKNVAIFSKDDPDVVFDRIFSDFPWEKVDENSSDENKYFDIYMHTKFDGWATLCAGTHLFIPE
ncbi:hypothetical protein [Gluconobacter frateurii]|uniref:DUF596 domain-containing protein n=1 Tax=Gluconobacter frateurii NRIC 0228 TaxID=1307946 RepID=A0ABQ0Q746_9PROT|nr:hypothetical protein [Gluconobacter frateurii]GBR07532.1 hypothetical protein AA0228_0035 [Gluconobacter frateurii NRIC 0228]GLP91400.1 hypothetical protein GCM10007868_24750 [Gluconobacter frateurii]